MDIIIGLFTIAALVYGMCMIRDPEPEEPEPTVMTLGEALEERGWLE